jgi:hypothetical protein
MEKCLTLFPHWAWAVIHGRKRIENRTWTTRLRGRLWIHASSRLRPITPGDRALLHDLPPLDHLATGAIIGHVSVVDVVPFHEAIEDEFATGPFCWLLENPTPIDPVPCPGQMALWTMPPRVLTAVQRTRSRRSRG